jgi:hypothetical protein
MAVVGVPDGSMSFTSLPVPAGGACLAAAAMGHHQDAVATPMDVCEPPPPTTTVKHVDELVLTKIFTFLGIEDRHAAAAACTAFRKYVLWGFPLPCLPDAPCGDGPSIALVDLGSYG